MLATGLLLAVLTYGAALADLKWRVQPVTVTTATGDHVFQSEIADTGLLRSRGLMERPSLASDRAMLFDFERNAPVTMWMKNTFISLDMIFIKPDGVVHSIARNTVPFSKAIISSGGPVRAVLEVAAGTSGRIELKPGDIVRHAIFDNDR